MSSETAVVIPAYNAAPFLAAAIDSALAQTVKPKEVIVVDDGSTDETGRIAASYGAAVTCVRQENAGVAAARNRGMEAATSRLVAFLDADDVWLGHKLERQLAVLAATPAAGASCSGFVVTDAALRPLSMSPGPSRAGLEDLLCRGNVVGTPSTVICSRALALQVGGFDRRFSWAADWHMWIKLVGVTTFAVVPEALVLYRQHGQSMTGHIAQHERESVALLTEAFGGPLPPSLAAQRRRALGRNYMVLAGTYFQGRAYGSFVRTLARALVLDPRLVSFALSYPARRRARL